jgi:hypothetical protein
MDLTSYLPSNVSPCNISEIYIDICYYLKLKTIAQLVAFDANLHQQTITFIAWSFLLNLESAIESSSPGNVTGTHISIYISDILQGETLDWHRKLRAVL